MSFPKKVKFDERGLIPAIIQDRKTGEVLMLAYMNGEALQKTLQKKRTHFYSRSRKKLWLKGETSGNVQRVQSVYYDCDWDAVLVKVTQKGGACHEGYRTCFFRKGTGAKAKLVGKRLFDPKKVYGG
ncbi:MAG: phosphoribosyl-AMP cyclohydrolase [Candidatus Omnitrophota bacterium]